MTLEANQDDVRAELSRQCGQWVGNMEWIKPKFSKGAVNRAGRILVAATPEEPGDWEAYWDSYYTALDIVNNWRASQLPAQYIQSDTTQKGVRG